MLESLNKHLHSHKSTNAIGVCTAILIGILFMYTTITPIYNKYQNHDQILNEVQSLETQMSETLQKKSKLQLNISQIQTSLNKNSEPLSSIKKLNTSVNRINTILTNTGYQITELHTSEPEPELNHYKTPITISGYCSITQLYSSIDSLRKQCPDITIDALEITSDSNSENLLNTKLVMLWYATPEL